MQLYFLHKITQSALCNIVLMFPTTHRRNAALRRCARFLDGCALTYVHTPTLLPHSTLSHLKYDPNTDLLDLFPAIVFAIVPALRNGQASKIAHWGR
jgi:hypothetical protein